jgi:hypothetical protein
LLWHWQPVQEQKVPLALLVLLALPAPKVPLDPKDPLDPKALPDPKAPLALLAKVLAQWALPIYPAPSVITTPS